VPDAGGQACPAIWAGGLDAQAKLGRESGHARPPPWPEDPCRISQARDRQRIAAVIFCVCEQDVSTVHPGAVPVAAAVTDGLATRGSLGAFHHGPGQGVMAWSRRAANRSSARRRSSLASSIPLWILFISHCLHSRRFHRVDCFSRNVASSVLAAVISANVITTPSMRLSSVR
jgi:hypothetical protein